MKNERALLLVVLSLVLARPCLAGSAGADPFAFLFLDANARPVALGGAYTALASDANALLYNPAGLGKIDRDEATFMHNVYLQGVAQDYAAFASPLGWGAGLNYLNFGDVPRTTLSNPDGGGLGQTSLTDLALGTGYGRVVTDSLSVGVGFKYIQEFIDSDRVRGYGWDVGALYAAPVIRGLTAGLAVQNMGPTARSSGARQSMPMNVRGGAAYGFKVNGHDSTLSFDVMKERSRNAVTAFGVETLLMEPLAMRLGYNGGNDQGLGLTVGFGYLFRAGSIDYAFVPMGAAGDAHRISVTVRWGPESKHGPGMQ